LLGSQAYAPCLKLRGSQEAINKLKETQKLETRTGRPRGRPVGAKNKRTVEREEAMKEASKQIASVVYGAFEGDAHAFLMAVYKDPDIDLKIRLDAAKAAICYELPRLASTKVSDPSGGNIIVEIVQFSEESGCARPSDGQGVQP
jgi:hypothetical protein